MRARLIYALTLLFHGILPGQPLDSLIALIPDNPGLRAIAAQGSAIAAKSGQVASWPEPMVSTSWFALPVETRLGPQIFRIGASQDIPWKGALDNKRAMVANQAMIPELQWSGERARLEFELTSAWYELAGMRKKILLLQKEKGWLDTRIELVRSRVSQGMTRLDALYLLEIDALAIDQQIASLEQHSAIPIARINGILSRQPDSPINVPEQMPEPVWLVDSIPDLERHPMVMVWETKKEGALLEMNQIHWDRNPYLTAGLDYIIVGQRDDADPSGNSRDIIAPRIGIRLPIASKKYSSREQEEQWRIRSFEADREETVNRLKASWQVARAGYEDARQTEQVLSQQQEWARKSLPLLINAWAEGKASMEEVLQVHRKIWSLDQQISDQRVKQHQAIARAREIMTQNERSNENDDQ